MGKYHGHPSVVISIKFAIRQAQLIEQVEVERVAFGHPVQTQKQDMTLEFTADAAAAGLIHRVCPRARGKVSDQRTAKVR
ncbi:hypothetical protein cym2001_19520 [Pseudomonas sp. CYM-20-01]|nr:hypothetical protein cym2001_19520 [Pseudomonas sp. CYM-20-01]